MSICVIDDQNRISLKDLFLFVSRFNMQTGFDLPDIYQWLNPDITDPENEQEGYRWEDASADYELFESNPEELLKKIPVEIANAFFCVCESFKIYGGKYAKNINAEIKRPDIKKSEGRVLIRDFKDFFEGEKERTGIKSHILWKLLPDEISAQYKLATYLDRFKKNYAEGTISKKLTDAIRNTYSKIPNESQAVEVSEGLVVPPFGSKHSFSVPADVASKQLKAKMEEAINKKLYKTGYDFTRYASRLLQINVNKIFDRGHESLPRLRVAICLALLEGHEIPQDVLDVHSSLLKVTKSRVKPTQDIGGLVHDK